MNQDIYITMNNKMIWFAWAVVNSVLGAYFYDIGYGSSALVCTLWIFAGVGLAEYIVSKFKEV